MFSWESGIRIFLAGLSAIASAILGVTSPIMAWATIMPIGPTITSTDFTVRAMAFSPVAPRFALAFSIWVVAIALVPRAIISMVSPKVSLSLLIIVLPIPPPWPSMTQIRFIAGLPILKMLVPNS